MLFLSHVRTFFFTFRNWKKEKNAWHLKCHYCFKVYRSLWSYVNCNNCTYHIQLIFCLSLNSLHKLWGFSDFPLMIHKEIISFLQDWVKKRNTPNYFRNYRGHCRLYPRLRLCFCNIVPWCVHRHVGVGKYDGYLTKNINFNIIYFEP